MAAKTKAPKPTARLTEAANTDTPTTGAPEMAPATTFPTFRHYEFTFRDGYGRTVRTEVLLCTRSRWRRIEDRDRWNRTRFGPLVIAAKCELT
jgi:hypothetical protein